MAESRSVADAVREACRGELAALKPGNVHAFADGHGMTVADFERSAEVVAEALGTPGLGVGERIFRAVDATRAAVGCNTNLGIVLLCAPLAQAALTAADAEPPREALRRVLAGLTVEDAVWAYRAIRRAAPGGLGTSARYDVHRKPEVTLLQAMAAARSRDRIARQYATGYRDVLELGLPRLAWARRRGWDAAWGATAVYFRFLARFPDSHIRRKLGREIAEWVRGRAAALDRELRASAEPGPMLQALLELDRELKERGLNPGTSADLTVATLFAAALGHEPGPRRLARGRS